MNLKSLLYGISLSVLLTSNAFSQNSEPLKTAYKQASHDTVRIRLDVMLGEHYELISSDSAMLYYNAAITLADKVVKENPSSQSPVYITAIRYKANATCKIGIVFKSLGNYDLAFKNIDQAFLLYEKINDASGMGVCASNKAQVFANQGNYDKAIEHFNKAYNLYTKANDQKGVASYCNDIGNVYRTLGQYDKALSFYIKALKIEESLKDEYVISQLYINMGVIYGEQKNPDKALEFFLKATALKEKLGDKQTLINCYLNIGTAYSLKADLNLALKYYQKALKISNELSLPHEEVMCYITMGYIYKELKQYNNALDTYTKAVKQVSGLGDNNLIIDVYGGTSALYITLSDSVAKNKTERNNYLDKSLFYAEKAYAIAKEIEVIYQQNNMASLLMEANKKRGNYQKALMYAEICISTNDSLFNEDKTNALAEMESKYQNEKKQKEIEILEKDKIINHAKTQRQRLIIIITLIGLGLLAFMITFIFRRLQITRRQKKIIEENNILLNEQNEEISSQRDEIESQRDMVLSQKEFIESQNIKITDSINYAKSIQHAVLPSSDILHKELKNSFVLYKPKNIVSGDFYWINTLNEYKIFTVADCTGHGVPGAFMSMLGISLFNEIVRNIEQPVASEILNRLRVLIIDALKQRGNFGEQKDGMDIVLCVLNTQTNILQYAGAYNPLYIVRNNNELEVIEPNMQPVSFAEVMQPFTNHEIKMNNGDCIYLSTDGFKDQFGGPKGKKFLSKQFRTLLQQIAVEPIDEQKNRLETTFENWRGDQEQVDDVTVMGLKM
jgi:tetratricopeptide (TPR) repeat protein/serine phosphatase RsbU (regulator of sigma subunit)